MLLRYLHRLVFLLLAIVLLEEYFVPGQAHWFSEWPQEQQEYVAQPLKRMVPPHWPIPALTSSLHLLLRPGFWQKLEPPCFFAERYALPVRVFARERLPLPPVEPLFLLRSVPCPQLKAELPCHLLQ